MNHPSTEILVLTWNGLEDTLRCVSSIIPQLDSKQASTGSVSLTVIDNGSTDGTAGEIRKNFPDVQLLELPENRGFTGGVMAAAARSSADLLLLLNNDAIVEEGWLQSSVESILGAPPDVIATAGKIIDISGTLVDFVSGVITFDGHAFQPGFRQPLATTVEPNPGSEMPFACGGNMIVRRKLFVELGGFDDDYFAYLEDVDFGWRAWLSGYRILYNPAAVVRHRSSATSDRLGDFERGVLFERNAFQTAVKNYESLQSSGGIVFLTLLHRLHTYSVERNEDTSALTKPPLGTLSSRVRPQRSLLQRLRRKVGMSIAGVDEKTVISDPLTQMQFRAVEWCLRNSELLMQKRSAVQSRRKRSDEEIFNRFPLHYVPTYPGDEELMQSALFRMMRPQLHSRQRTLQDMITR